MIFSYTHTLSLSPSLVTVSISLTNFLLDECPPPSYLTRGRLQKRLYAQLLANESWRDGMTIRMREAVQKSGGISEITLDELAATLILHGKQMVPQSVQTDVMARIRQHIP